MYTSIRHYSLSVEREAARRRPQARVIVLAQQPSLFDRIRAIFGRSAANAYR